MRFPAIGLVPDDIQSMTFSDDRSGKRSVILTGNADIREFMKLLKNEIVKMSYNDMTSKQDHDIWLSILDNKDKETNIQIQGSFTSLIEWLKNKGYYDRFALLLDDIKSVELENADSPRYSNKAVTPKRVEIKERAVIEELLNIDSSTDYNSNTVIARFNTRYSSWEKHVNIDTAASARLKGYFGELENN